MYYGLDVHKEFIQVCALGTDGEARREFRIGASAEAITEFAQDLERTDQVVLEATFHTWAIHSILSRHVERVVVANPVEVKAIAHARIKTDKVDAFTLARLLRADFLPEVQMPTRRVWALRQLMTHRRQLGKQSTAAKNTIHGVLNRSLRKYPGAHLFTGPGLRWLATLKLPACERLILDHQLGLLEQVQERLRAVDEELLRQAQLRHDTKLLVTIPGVDVTVAMGLLAAIGSIDRFPTPAQMASYFGLTPRIRQSASTLRRGSITKAGSRSGRWLAIEAAHTMARSGAPLAASYHRIRRKKGHAVAVTATARKMMIVVWHVLTKGEPYRYSPVERTRQKLRKVARKPRRRGWRAPRNLEEVYREAGLDLSEPSEGEKRTARNNRIALARYRGESSPS